MRRARKYLHRLRAPALAFLAAALLHVTLAPSIEPDCHERCPAPTSHADHNHALCHCSCCHHGEFSVADDHSFSAVPRGWVAATPDGIRGRDVIFQLYRPPQIIS